MTDTCTMHGWSCSIDCDHPPCKSRIAGIVGMAGMMIIIFGILYAAIAYPGYNFSMWLSELGNTANSPGSFTFNASLVIGGSIIAFFPALLCGVTKNKWLAAILVIAGLLSGFSLVLVGLNPMNIDSTAHFIWSGIAFASMAITSGIMTTIIFSDGGKNIPAGFGIIFIIVAFIASIFFLTFFIGMSISITAPTAQITEWASVMLFAVGMVGISIYEMS